VSHDDTNLRPGVIFDVDGTLLDTNYLHVLAWWQAMNDAGHEGVSMSAIHRAIGIASEGLVEHLLGRVDDKAVKAHSERYKALRDQVVAFPKAAELMRECKRRGYVVVLATSGAESDLKWMLPAIGAEDAVAGVTTSTDVEQAKPAPDLLATAVRDHNLDPERTVALGDTVWDVESARKAGLSKAMLRCGGISQGELEEAGADEIYENPADLLDRFDESVLGRYAPG